MANAHKQAHIHMKELQKNACRLNADRLCGRPTKTCKRSSNPDLDFLSLHWLLLPGKRSHHF